MIFMFTTTNHLSSALIRWGLDTDVSHFAVTSHSVLNTRTKVTHSNLTRGVHEVSIGEFLESNKIVYAFRLRNHDAFYEWQLYERMLIHLRGKAYDAKGVSFLTMSVIFCVKLFGKTLPKENKWADKSQYYCSEVLQFFREYLEEHAKMDFSEFNPQMLTPDRGLHLFRGSLYIEDVTEEVNAYRKIASR